MNYLKLLMAYRDHAVKAMDLCTEIKNLTALRGRGFESKHSTMKDLTSPQETLLNRAEAMKDRYYLHVCFLHTYEKTARAAIDEAIPGELGLRYARLYYIQGRSEADIFEEALSGLKGQERTLIKRSLSRFFSLWERNLRNLSDEAVRERLRSETTGERYQAMQRYLASSGTLKAQYELALKEERRSRSKVTRHLKSRGLLDQAKEIISESQFT